MKVCSAVFLFASVLAGEGQTSKQLPLSYDDCIKEYTPLMMKGSVGAKELCKPLMAAPKPEAQDVPAIKEKHLHQCVHHERYCAVIPEAENPECPCDRYEDVPFDTCADKSRVLLTAENGSKHCVKFSSVKQ